MDKHFNKTEWSESVLKTHTTDKHECTTTNIMMIDEIQDETESMTKRCGRLSTDNNGHVWINDSHISIVMIFVYYLMALQCTWIWL